MNNPMPDQYDRLTPVVKADPPKISIVTPSYNQGEFLEECIDSILSQGYPNLEYVIMDGGSTDNSVEIIKKYERYLTYWRSAPDGGQYAAINAGFKRTSGDVMAWLNSDDKYHPGALDTVGYIFQNHPEINWLTGRPTAWNTDGSLQSISPVARRWTRSDLLDTLPTGDFWFVQQESTFWHRSLWEHAQLKVGLDYAGDFDLWLQFSRTAWLQSVDVWLGGYRHHEGQKVGHDTSSYVEEVGKLQAAERLVVLPTDQTERSTVIPPVLSVRQQDVVRWSSSLTQTKNSPENHRSQVLLGTSLVPKGGEIQRTCVDSWLKAGFSVVSVNSGEEIEELRGDYPEVRFEAVARDGRNLPLVGKPVVFIDDFLKVLRESEQQVVGIVNADILFSPAKNLPAWVYANAVDGLLYGSRIDVPMLGETSGSLYGFGFDFFFMNRSFIEELPDTGFLMGMPYWDYWLPIAAASKGIPLRRVDSSWAFHQLHETNYGKEQLWHFAGVLVTALYNLEMASIQKAFPAISFKTSLDFEVNSFELLSNVLGLLHELSVSTRIDEVDARQAVERGEWYFQQNQPDNALREFHRGLELDPESVRALNDLAVLQWAEGDGCSALSTLHSAVLIDPEYPDSTCNLAEITDANGDLEGAVNLLVEYIEKYQNNVTIIEPLLTRMMCK